MTRTIVNVLAGITAAYLTLAAVVTAVAVVRAERAAQKWVGVTGR